MSTNFERNEMFFRAEPTARIEPHYNGLRRARLTAKLLLFHQHALDILTEQKRLHDTGKFLEYAERDQELSMQYLQTLTAINETKSQL